MRQSADRKYRFNDPNVRCAVGLGIEGGYKLGDYVALFEEWDERFDMALACILAIRIKSGSSWSSGGS